MSLNTCSPCKRSATIFPAVETEYLGDGCATHIHLDVPKLEWQSPAVANEFPELLDLVNFIIHATLIFDQQAQVESSCGVLSRTIPLV
jgi:hypothetical protein